MLRSVGDGRPSRIRLELRRPAHGSSGGEEGRRVGSGGLDVFAQLTSLAGIGMGDGSTRTIQWSSARRIDSGVGTCSGGTALLT